ncbi:ABC transporter permease [Caenimonas aquaedulcis]|uniref:ABC transporter permease n=1 Tax=Caenimonas aquaedulcis TaxID=2793270 RepID=A0A931H8T0_9BURK|nr:ABC transporter permease [Caenimonas aquaedulcis]MBG9390492.1 ABC transporter permease [Caenimonas aquaedulcis]
MSAVLPAGDEPLLHVRRAEGVRVHWLSRPLATRSVAVAAPLVLLAVWEALVRAGWLDARFFPAPSSIVGTFQHMAWGLPWKDSLGWHVLVSLSRALIGFALGALPAIVVGALMGLMPLLRAAIQPMVGALYPIPKVAILPLVMLIFGIGEESKWAIIAVGVFFQVLIATAAGVANIDRIYLDVGANFKASRTATFFTIALPGALPVIFAGLRLGWGAALLLLVTAEMVSSQSGIGFIIWRAWQLMSVEDMYVGLVVIAFIGIVSFWLLDMAEARLLPWKKR